MKNARYELFARMQRQYHRGHPWRLTPEGLYIPHLYTETKQDSLSTGDDVGFILNSRRIMVWWTHPRCFYSAALQSQARQEAGDGPNDNWLTEGSTKNYRQVGSSRKKVIGYTSRQPSAEQMQHYDRLRDIKERLTVEGIDLDVPLGYQREQLTWATGISLVAPLEVRNETELAAVAQLARRLLLGQTTLEAEFPGYRYSRTDWLREHEKA